MATPTPPDVRERHEREDGPRELARRTQAFHRQAMPEAVMPPVVPFTKVMLIMLLVGILVGGVGGYFFGDALFSGEILIPGWEGIYSMLPNAFYFMWIMIGAALGIVIIGGGTLLVYRPPRAARPRHERVSR